MPLHPLQLVSYEGFWGFFIHILLVLPITSLLSCTSTFCSYPRHLVEDPFLAWQELDSNRTLACLTLLFIAIVPMVNCLGVHLTQAASASQRVVVDQARVIFVWGFFYLAMP